jgi:hypothetical protein
MRQNRDAVMAAWPLGKTTFPFGFVKDAGSAALQSSGIVVSQIMNEINDPTSVFVLPQLSRIASTLQAAQEPVGVDMVKATRKTSGVPTAEVTMPEFRSHIYKLLTATYTALESLTFMKDIKPWWLDNAITSAFLRASAASVAALKWLGELILKIGEDLGAAAKTTTQLLKWATVGGVAFMVYYYGIRPRVER